MDDETRKVFAEVRAETRDGFAEVRAEMREGFAKIDHWFEKNYEEHVRTRAEIDDVRKHLARHDQEFMEVRGDIAGLRQEFRRFTGLKAL